MVFRRERKNRLVSHSLPVDNSLFLHGENMQHNMKIYNPCKINGFTQFIRWEKRKINPYIVVDRIGCQ